MFVVIFFMPILSIGFVGMGKDRTLYTESSMTNLLSLGFLKDFETTFGNFEFYPSFIVGLL